MANCQLDGTVNIRSWPRFCPEKIILDKAKVLERSFEERKVIIVDNQMSPLGVS